MRVLHILNELRPSGAEVMLCSAAECFSRSVNSADVLATGKEIGSYAQRFSEAGYTVHHLPFRRQPAFFLELWKFIRRGDYDVVHLHSERASFWLGVTALASGGKRVLRTIHNNFEFEGRLGKIRGWQRRMLARLGVTHVAISPGVQENEQLRFHLHTTIVPNWYDSRRFVQPTADERQQTRERLQINGRIAIVTVGNCSLVKNHVALLNALAILPEQDRPVWLHLGDEDEQGTERQLAQELGIDECVRFLGSQPDVRPFLYAADLYLMPSLFEGLSIAAVEALAVGLPALFTDVPGLRDFRENFPGLIYSGTDADSLATALRQYLARDENYWREQSRIYSVNAKRLYSIEPGVAAYLDIYRGEKS